MKWIKAACVFILLFGVLASSAAWAHGRGGGGGPGLHGHHGLRGHHGHFHRGAHVGVFVGAPLFVPWYYPPRPYYYYPPVVAAPALPPVYIEQSTAQDAQQAAGYWWYYCNDPQGYYPYVKQCSTSWQKVAPQPAS
jgi:hypothetical protein